METFWLNWRTGPEGGERNLAISEHKTAEEALAAIPAARARLAQVVAHADIVDVHGAWTISRTPPRAGEAIGALCTHQRRQRIRNLPGDRYSCVDCGDIYSTAPATRHSAATWLYWRAGHGQRCNIAMSEHETVEAALAAIPAARTELLSRLGWNVDERGSWAVSTGAPIG